MHLYIFHALFSTFFLFLLFSLSPCSTFLRPVHAIRILLLYRIRQHRVISTKMMAIRTNAKQMHCCWTRRTQCIAMIQQTVPTAKNCGYTYSMQLCTRSVCSTRFAPVFFFLFFLVKFIFVPFCMCRCIHFAKVFSMSFVSSILFAM